MMISNAEEAFVWIWLPKVSSPIVAGKLVKDGGRYLFVYGKTYLERSNAIPLSPFELPLERKVFEPTGVMSIASCLRDAAPDAWGRRLIEYEYPNFNPNELDFFLLSESNRIGGLDFTGSSKGYLPREAPSALLAEIDEFAKVLEGDKPLTKKIAHLVFHGTSIGGARPKCFVSYEGAEFIAKFSLSTDYYPVIKMEYIAMRLAKLVGLDVAAVKFARSQERDVLLVKRFDRDGPYRKLMLSALSLMGLDEMEARYASYQKLSDIIRKDFYSPLVQLRELFKRLVFNILVGNTDDHARNHSAFWDGKGLVLTPAYDLCPQRRVGFEATQAMQIGGVDGNFSTLQNVFSIYKKFGLDESDARGIIDNQIKVIRDCWSSVCEQAGLGVRDQNTFFGSVVLSEYSLRSWYSPATRE